MPVARQHPLNLFLTPCEYGFLYVLSARRRTIRTRARPPYGVALIISNSNTVGS